MAVSVQVRSGAQFESDFFGSRFFYLYMDFANKALLLSGGVIS